MTSISPAASLRIASIVLGTTLVLTACGGRDPASSAQNPGTVTAATERVVNVSNWPDYIAPGLVEQFTAETGIRVNYSTFDGNEMLETKLLTGNSGYDVVVPSAAFLQRQVAAGGYQPINRARLSNYGNLDPGMMALLATNDPGNLHSVGNMWGTTGIGYDARKVTALAPDAPTDSWRLVFDPKVAERLASCGIAFIDAPSEILSVTLIALGRDPYSEDPADLAAAEAALLAIRPYVRYVNTVPLLEDLATGNLCVAVLWSGDAVRARVRATEAKVNSDIRYVIPAEGTLSWFDVLAIPSDAPHPVEAHAFIDFMLRADVAAKNATSVRYATFNRAALPLLDPSLAGDTATYPTAEARATACDAATHAGTDPRREPDLDAVSDRAVTPARVTVHRKRREEVERPDDCGRGRVLRRRGLTSAWSEHPSRASTHPATRSGLSTVSVPAGILVQATCPQPDDLES